MARAHGSVAIGENDSAGHRQPGNASLQLTAFSHVARRRGRGAVSPIGLILLPLQQAPPDLPDPNALYAAVIQASATIVAIVGGFVTATVINIATERRSLEDEVADLRQELEDATSDVARAAEERDRLSARHLIWLRDEETVGWGDRLPAADIARRRLRAEGVPAAVFAEEWAAFAVDMAAARSAVDDYMNDYRDIETGRTLELDEWLGDRGPRLTPRGEQLADYIQDVRNREARERFASLTIEPITFRNQDWEVSEQERWQRDIDRRVERCQASVEEFRRLEWDVARRERRLRYARRPPPSLWLGMAALAVLAIGGIGFPLVLMPQAAAAYEPWQKLSVIGGFALGLVLSCWYVGWLLCQGGGSEGSA